MQNKGQNRLWIPQSSVGFMFPDTALTQPPPCPQSRPPDRILFGATELSGGTSLWKWIRTILFISQRWTRNVLSHRHHLAQILNFAWGRSLKRKKKTLLNLSYVQFGDGSKDFSTDSQSISRLVNAIELVRPKQKWQCRERRLVQSTKFKETAIAPDNTMEGKSHWYWVGWKQGGRFHGKYMDIIPYKGKCPAGKPIVAWGWGFPRYQGLNQDPEAQTLW